MAANQDKRTPNKLTKSRPLTREVSASESHSNQFNKDVDVEKGEGSSPQASNHFDPEKGESQSMPPPYVKEVFTEVPLGSVANSNLERLQVEQIVVTNRVPRSVRLGRNLRRYWILYFLVLFLILMLGIAGFILHKRAPSATPAAPVVTPANSPCVGCTAIIP